jgi:peroxiredoxin Q/BCP
LGISSDSLDSHTRFSSKYGLPFTLLIDSDNRVRRLYGVHSTLGIIPGRVTFVIDPQGIVQHIFDSQFNPRAHVEEALAALRSTEAKAVSSSSVKS